MPRWLGRALVVAMVGLVAVLPVVAWPHWSHAQITTDGSLGPARTLGGPSVTIGSDLGRIRGANLFHSFGQFNVNTGQSVTFTGPTSIGNILSRVTGGSPSMIDGLLRSTIPGANMFLLNPSGVLFGPNAALDIGGSFHVTTADYIRFPDGGIFHANLANQTVLSVAPPAAFGFLSVNPAPVSAQGSLLEVLPGRSLSLVGGDVEIVGGVLAAPGGRMSLISVGGAAGEATFNAATQTPDLAPRNGVTGAQVSLNGARLLSESLERGGRIVIRGSRLVAEQSVALVNNAGPDDGNAVGIDIKVANDVVVDGSLFGTGTVVARGGDIALTARSISIGGGASLQARSTGNGNAGNVTIIAGDSFRSFGGSVTTEAAIGDGGNIGVFVPRLVHLVDSRVTTSVQGGSASGGNITIDPRFLILIRSEIRADTFGGSGGNVTLVADIFLRTDSVLSASSALGAPGVVNDFSGTLDSLPESVLQGAPLLREACRVRLAEGPASSFVLAGRGGLPPGLGGLLPSPLLEEPVPVASMSAAPSFSPIVLTVSCR
jgi:filamentous hemagglutinin family protein